MKKICALIMGISLLLGTTIAEATTTTLPTSTLKESTTIITTFFNAFGVAISSISTTTTVVETKDANGNITTDRTVTTVNSTYKDGGVKTDRVHTVATQRNAQGNELSKNEFTDTYTYNDKGELTGVSGKGISVSKDQARGHTNTGEITRTFIVRDGQALLTESKTTGTTKDRNGNQIGTFTNSTTIREADYQYLGGVWVPMRQTSTTAFNRNNGDSQTITRVLTYSRNEHGVITGLTQTASGREVVVTGNRGPGEVASQTSVIDGYTITTAFDPQMGWYIAEENITWRITDVIRNPNPNPDPMLYGEIVNISIDGVEYIGISIELIDILDGKGVQKADGEVWILTGELAGQLKAFVGQKVMVMGDVAGQTGENFVLKIREDYGGGIVTDNVDQALATYQDASWYKANLEMMSKVWAQVRAEYGSHSHWKQGVEFLLRLFGL